jgi:hypothetical protein
MRCQPTRCRLAAPNRELDRLREGGRRGARAVYGGRQRTRTLCDEGGSSGGFAFNVVSMARLGSHELWPDVCGGTLTREGRGGRRLLPCGRLSR